jgi:hypothetical protein
MAKYADGFRDYGYETLDVLLEAETDELSEALEDLKVKKGHRNILMRAFEKAKADAAGRTRSVSIPMAVTVENPLAQQRSKMEAAL